ncbi:DUF481 domain-containing protein [Opitutus terrae]|uniref:DUF481 domain-containing protein n=1 Tax=Opitutus terrae TaxID=107709 RepID=UPI0011D0A9D9|nr:DUF481 domain-containing protein [Opitutus terrae]
MSSSTFLGRGPARLLTALLCGLVGSFAARPAVAFTEVRGPSFAQSSRVPATANPPAAAAEKPALDQLVFKDGDRVRGKLVEHAGNVLVFQSERFGLLRVPTSEAEVILAQPVGPAVATTATPDQEAAVAERVEEGEVSVERWPFSPLQMAAALKEFFGSWHGRFSVATEVLEDARQHGSATVEAKLQRKWKNDEVQLTGRYDYASTNEVAATDMVKADGVWRHDFPRKLFSVYRPSVEWNRQFYRDGAPSDYVLMQQEVGAGVNLFNTDTRKLRAGVSENLFDVWVTPTDFHTSHAVESVFTEIEAKLPWRITLTDRSVWYYSIASQTDGWENRFEVSKKLTETLTIAARHDIRRNNPDERAADYERLRVLFGVDF